MTDLIAWCLFVRFYFSIVDRNFNHFWFHFSISVNLSSFSLLCISSICGDFRFQFLFGSFGIFFAIYSEFESTTLQWTMYRFLSMRAVFKMVHYYYVLDTFCYFFTKIKNNKTENHYRSVKINSLIFSVIVAAVGLIHGCLYAFFYFYIVLYCVAPQIIKYVIIRLNWMILLYCWNGVRVKKGKKNSPEMIYRCTITTEKYPVVLRQSCQR